ncbi:DUF6090 family protein [Flavobacteriaceae bacterium]|jgi:hypothetical protein|nr:DUF6090 family protein [Flavobacteriaceae bacterium]
MKFFRPFRQNSKGNFDYIKYALGEVILVVIGILIALQVNNFNEKRIEKRAMKDYFQKISFNINADIKESERLLKFRQDHIVSCNKVSKALIENDFSNQLLIQKAIFEMIIEVQLNYNKDAFESLKSSGYLRYLNNKELEELLNDYYNQINQIEMFEIDQRDWANALELELDRNGFFYSYTQLDQKVHTDLFTLMGNYTLELKKHPGHKIIMRLLFRGGTNNSFLTGFYENHIKTGNQLIDVLNQEINH